MNRTDRLVALVMLLQSRRVVTAAEMAGHFEVTERTIYRDLAALGEGGVPIIGEAGVGYRLMRGYHLPPVMFSPPEAYALVTAATLAENLTDDSVRREMRTALGKLNAMLPQELQGKARKLQLFTHVGKPQRNRGKIAMSKVQEAMAERRILRVGFRETPSGAIQEKVIEPMGLAYQAGCWHLLAWCGKEFAMHDIRTETLESLEVLAEPTPPRPGFDIGRYLKGGRDWMPLADARLEIHAGILDHFVRDWGSLLEVANAEGETILARLQYADEQGTARKLLAYGEAVSVLSPPSLRLAIVKQAERSIRHHRQEARNRKSK